MFFNIKKELNSYEKGKIRTIKLLIYFLGRPFTHCKVSDLFEFIFQMIVFYS